MVALCLAAEVISIRELKQATFLTTRTSTGSKFDVISQSRFLAQSFDVTRAARDVKNVGCLSSLFKMTTVRMAAEEGGSFQNGGGC